jgi:membrane-bound metal-dependent hydrolase YbcI (DUF457 family)
MLPLLKHEHHRRLRIHEITSPMDPIAHSLASYSLKRVAFPRVTLSVTVAMVLAGTIADVDWLSAYFGPSAFLAFYRTCFHSFTAGFLLALLVTLPFLFRYRWSPEKHSRLLTIFAAALAAAVLHLIMDVCQSAGVELFWPFSTRPLSLDLAAHLDLWILVILLAGILLPKLTGLVTEEIGVKSKGPKGRVGASLTFIAILLYLGLRFVFHGNALASIESRTYRSESPRKIAVFAEPGSPFRWHAIVETESALHDVKINVGPRARVDLNTEITSYKPEASPALDTARNSPVARRFLQIARFPKATVEKTVEGYHVELRDLGYAATGKTRHEVAAIIDLDAEGKIVHKELVWAQDLHRR